MQIPQSPCPEILIQKATGKVQDLNEKTKANLI